MNKEAPGLGRILVISGFSLSCFGLLLFLWLAFGGPIPLQPKGYRIKVAFDDAAQLAAQADVRVAGVTVGKVVGKELADEGNRTLAEIELEEQYAPVRSDARAILRQKTLLGETYVEMTTGSADAEALQEGDRLPDGRVADVVEFDELLRIFDEDTRAAFRGWQASLAEAGDGRSEDLNGGLGNLPVFTSNAGDVARVLAGRRAALRALVRNTGTTFEAITRNEGALSTLLRRNTEVFEELAGRRGELERAIRIFPTFLRESEATLARLRAFAPATEPLLRDLDPVLDDTQPTLRDLGRLSPDLRELFLELDPLITASRTGLPALARTLRGLDPTLRSTGPFLQQLNPILEFLEYNQVKISDFLNVGPNALGGIRATPPGSKSNGHVLPQVIVAGTQSLPAARRTPDNRGNAYLAPFQIGDPDILTLQSFDCGNSGAKAPTSTPGCKPQGDFSFQGLGQRFPQVREGGPGGTRRVGG